MMTILTGHKIATLVIIHGEGDVGPVILQAVGPASPHQCFFLFSSTAGLILNVVIICFTGFPGAPSIYVRVGVASLCDGMILKIRLQTANLISQRTSQFASRRRSVRLTSLTHLSLGPRCKCTCRCLPKRL